MGTALGWGALAASSLVIGALIALIRPWPERAVGLVLAFGAGALISAVSFELAEEAIEIGDRGAAAVGLGAGALVYYVADGLVSGGKSPGRSGRMESPDAGNALALGAFLDGIPEQLVLGIGIAVGDGVGIGLLIAIFVSNLPEAIGSASDMRKTGRTDTYIVRLWIGVAVICTLASGLGYLIGDMASNNVMAVLDGFAAGALIVLLVDSMIPEARKTGGRAAGLVTTLGFALAAGMSAV